MSQLDELDLEVVNMLMEDGRMPSAEIARRIGGISERAVRYRINRLIKNGIIRIGAIPNPRALGYVVVADVWLEVEADSIRDVAMKMTEHECVSYVAYAIGENDVSVQVVAHDTQEVYRFVTGVIGRTPGVRKTVTSIVPQVLKDVYQWHIPKSFCIGDDFD
jgi:Lrp/AsnC family transcriptional regulator for asnA, asnC and gidA